MLLLAALLWTLPLPAAQPSVTRLDPRRVLQVQAAYLINFLRYAEWSGIEVAGSPLVVAVIGREQVVATVVDAAAVAGPVHGRPVKVVAIAPEALGRGAHGDARAAAVERLRSSHLVFLDAGSGVTATELVSAVRGFPVLTVGNGPGFVAAGGMLQLFVLGRNVVFGANPEPILASGVVLSAQVLKLARPIAGGVH